MCRVKPSRLSQWGVASNSVNPSPEGFTWHKNQHVFIYLFIFSMILSGYPLDTLRVSHEGKKKTVIGISKDETPIRTLRHFPSTLRGKKKSWVFTSFWYVGPNTPSIIFIFFPIIHAFFLYPAYIFLGKQTILLCRVFFI